MCQRKYGGHDLSAAGAATGLSWTSCIAGNGLRSVDGALPGRFNGLDKTSSRQEDD